MKTGGGRFGKHVISRRDTAEERHQSRRHQDCSQDSLQDDRGYAGTFVSVGDEAPSQPEKCFEMLPVHGEASASPSSHDSF